MMVRYKELSDLRHTEAEEILERFKANEGYREQGLLVEKRQKVRV
jgi:hypothetical protein